MLILSTFLLICVTNLVSSERLFLTPYIEANLTEEAKNLSSVNGLPNAPTVESYSGFITVDKQYNSNLFFWFFPSFTNKTTAPLIIWLEGGPGSSTIWSIFSFNSVFCLDKNQSLSLSPHAWAHNYSMLYIDNPVGAGFSFTQNPNGYSRDQNSVANNLYEFIRQFFTLFSEYSDKDLYIMGESYGGKFVPALAYKLMQMSNESNINLKGIAIGNPLIDPINQMVYSKQLKSLGYIDQKQMQIFEESEEEIRSSITRGQYRHAYLQHRTMIFDTYSLMKTMSGHKNVYDLSLSKKDWIVRDQTKIYKFIRNPATEKALHVDKHLFILHSSKVYNDLIPDIMTSMEKNFTELIEKYKVMLYVGNFDILISVDSVSSFLEKSDWKYREQFYHAKREVWKMNPDDEEITGFMKTFGNFTFAIIRNAGHFVAYDKPNVAQQLINKFINAKSDTSANEII